MKKKKILFIHYGLGWGGVEKVLTTILNYFDYSLFDVDLLLIYRGNETLLDLPKDVKVTYLYSKYLSVLEKINYNLFSRFGLDWGYRLLTRYKIGKKKYDVIISFTGGAPLRYHTYLMSKGTKNLSWLHTDLFTYHYSIDRLFTESKEKDAYSKIDKIVFVSNDAKRQFEKLYPDIITPKEVILNPIEKDLIAQIRKEYKNYYGDRYFNIVSVGRLSKEKGFDRLIRLAKILKYEGYNFHINIIGEGSYRKELEDLIVEYMVEDKVSLLGFINPPYEIMSNADLFILTSIVEGFALVVCEAFCLGLPIVSTKTAGPIELIDNNKYGLLTDHDDESIYKAVKKIIDDDNLREYYHKKSLERAEILGVDAVMKQIYNIL